MKEGFNIFLWDNYCRSQKKPKVLLQCSHFCQRWLCCFQVAGPACLDFGRGFGTPVRVSAVILCHGFNIAATPHPPTWNVIFFSQWRKAAPIILGYLRSNREGQRNIQEEILYCCNRKIHWPKGADEIELS